MSLRKNGVVRKTRKDKGKLKSEWTRRFDTDFKNVFYTYIWFRKNFTPYYVGKGTGRRAFVSQSHIVRRPRDVARIVVQIWESKEKALEMEKWYIAFYGRKNIGTGLLRNITAGGEDPPLNSHKGFKHSEETKQVLSQRKLEAWKDPEYAKHMSDVHTRIHFNEDQIKELVSLRMQGQTLASLSQKFKASSGHLCVFFQELKVSVPKATHCKNGHEYTPENSYVYKGKSYCRQCRLDASQRSKAKQKEEKENGS